MQAAESCVSLSCMSLRRVFACTTDGDSNALLHFVLPFLICKARQVLAEMVMQTLPFSGDLVMRNKRGSGTKGEMGTKGERGFILN